MGVFSVRLTEEEWNRRRKEVHGDKYECLDEFKGYRVKLRFVCKEHGIFEQNAGNHLRGMGCRKCHVDKVRMTQEEFDKKRREVHGDKYQCLDPYPKNNRVKIRFVCPDHGEFLQDPNGHLMGKGCRKCAVELTHSKQRTSQEEWERKRQEVHGDKYECLNLYVDNTTKLTFICPEHGEFKMTPNAHVDQRQGCPTCLESRGERRIVNALSSSGLVCDVDYFRQHKFEGCKRKRPLPFDFYIPKLNLLIEYDGIQHFKRRPLFGGDKAFTRTQENDQIKNDYCSKNNIKLVRIPYTHFNEIETILDFVLEDVVKLAA